MEGNITAVYSLTVFYSHIKKATKEQIMALPLSGIGVLYPYINGVLAWCFVGPGIGLCDNRYRTQIECDCVVVVEE